MPLINDGYTAPRVSTPAPYDIPRWDDEVDVGALNDAYTAFYGLTEQIGQGPQAPPIMESPLKLKSLKQWGMEAPVRKAAQASAQSDEVLSDAAGVAGTRLGSMLGKMGVAGGSSYGQTAQSMIPQGRAGLSAYGVQSSGLANQRGKGMKGLQGDFSTALTRMFSDMKRGGIGTPGITDGWRSYDQQVALKKAKPKLAASPGRSVHGIGYAADLALNSAQQKWMEANAWRYGIYRLSNEPWHWQYWPASKRGKR